MSIITQQIPLDTVACYEQLVALEGSLFTLTFTFSDHYGSWHMDIKTSTGVRIVDGVRLVPLYPMILDYALSHLGLSGAFYLMPITSVDLQRLPDTTTKVDQLATYYTLQYMYDDGAPT